MRRLRHTRRRPHPEPCTPDGAGTGARRAGRGRGRARPGKGSGNAPRLQRAGLGWELAGASAVGAGGRAAGARGDRRTQSAIGLGGGCLVRAGPGVPVA